ncbi:MAG: MFS transporter, partial [bacterium]
MASRINKNLQYYKFCLYGFFKNLRFFDAFLILFFLSEDLTYVQIGVLYSVKEIIMVIAEIPGGVIADAMGRKKIMVLSFITYIGSFLIFYFAGRFFAFLMAMVVYSLGDSFRTGVHKAMIYHYLKVNGKEDQKVNYYGHTRSWSQTGTAISSLVAGFLVFYTDSYRIIYLASIVPYILDLLLLISYPSYLDGEKHSFAPRRIIIEFRTVIRDFWDSLKSWRMIKTMTNTSLYTGYYRAIKDYYQPLLKALALALPVMAYLD